MGVPDGKYLFGMVRVGEKGQIVIPKKARDVFNIKSGDTLVVLGDDKEQGIALMRSEVLMDFARQLMNTDLEVTE